MTNEELLRDRKLCLISLSGTPKASYGATEASEEERGLPVTANRASPNETYGRKVVEAASSLCLDHKEFGVALNPKLQNPEPVNP